MPTLHYPAPEQPLTTEHESTKQITHALHLSATTVSRNEVLEVRLSRNQLSGPLPSWLASLPVILLDVSYNRLSGSLPAAALGNNLVLQELLLAGNQFSGSLSADVLRYARCCGGVQTAVWLRGRQQQGSAIMHGAKYTAGFLLVQQRYVHIQQQVLYQLRR
jgi:hypothetical protein